MKSKYFYTFSLLSLVAILVFAGCTKEWKDKIGTGPELTIANNTESISGINVGDEVTISVNAQSQSGVKRLSYFFIRNIANGTEAGTPVHFDQQDLPPTLQKDIVFTVVDNMAELVVVAWNKENFSSEAHITISEIRKLPVLTFKDNIKYQETVFENKVLNVQGQITSEFDLASISYKTVVNGTSSSETAIAFTDKKNTPFNAAVNVVTGLTDIIINAENIHGGAVSDTFKIGAVAEDAVSIALAGGATKIDVVYADSLNTISGNAGSGSDFQSLTYSISKNGVYGTEQEIALGTPLDEFPFSFSFEGEKGIDGIRITGNNTGGKTQVLTFQVSEVYSRILHFPNIVLTNEIGPGKNNWFSAYQAPHVFDITNAAQNQMMLDFAFIKYTAVANRLVPAAVYNAGTAYRNAMAPYMVGFTKAPYTMVTANRAHITTTAVSDINWDGQMQKWLQENIIAPVNQGGENYNLVVANRRVSGDMVPGTGVVIGWGSWNFANSVVVNQAFGIVLVKSYVEANGFATVTLDIRVPAEDNRTKFNPVSLFDYP